MAAKTRQLQSSKQQEKQRREQQRRSARTRSDWRTLATKALDAALKANDRRAQGIQIAITQGTEERTLKALHIICDNDITRVFTQRS